SDTPTARLRRGEQDGLTRSKAGGSVAASGSVDPASGARPGPDPGLAPAARPLDRYTVDVVGTRPYMAPEQHVGRPLDARTDQYSFCLALYEGLYGQRPFVEVEPP